MIKLVHERQESTDLAGRKPGLEAVAERLANFERYFESIAHPFEWKFTRADLNALVARMRDRWAHSQNLKLAA